MIPKILHVVWVGDESKRPDFCIDTWRQQHPTWRLKVWGNAAFERTAWVNKAHMEAMWSRELNGVADMMRYEILYREGGVAIDADSVCQRALPDWMLEPQVFACYENEFARPGLVAAGALGAVAHNPFIGQIILDIKQSATVIDKRAWETVGPMRITETWRAHQYPLTVYPSHYFIPEHFAGQQYKGTGPVFATQWWGSTRGSYEHLPHLAATPEMDRPTLNECFARHHTDKSHNGYTASYERILAPLRDEPIRLLEIGVGTIVADAPSSMRYVYGDPHPYRPGASLRAWRDYLPNATIVGGDIQPDCVFKDTRISVRLFDSTDRRACDAALGDDTFDLIIDDGLHTLAANVCTLRNLWHRLLPGGWYCMEDVHPPLYDHWRDVFSDLDASMDAHDNGQWAMLMFRKLT